MATITIEQYNEVHCKIRGEKGYLLQLQNHFTYFAEGYRWNPKYRNGLWDGKIRCLNMKDKTFPKGLIPELIEYCESVDIDVELEEDLFPVDDLYDLTEEQVVEFYEKIGGPYKPKYYQIDGVQTALGNGRSILLSPTASGKSYLLYGIARFYQLLGKKVLIVIDMAGLVKQLAEDNFLDEYDQNRGTFTAHAIYSGKDKSAKADIVVSTWQSIVNMPKEFFDQFDVLIGDEVHSWKAASLIKINEKCTNIAFRHGVTGTLDDIEANETLVKGMFGPPKLLATTKELIDSGDVANLDIKAIMFSYPEEERKALRKNFKKYPEEIEFLVNHQRRLDMISRIIRNLDGNVLVAFRKEDHGKMIFENLKTNRKKFFVNSKVHVDKRSEYQKEMDQSENMIGVVSLGTFAKGINIKNVNYVILASPLKSKVNLLQLIGRGLRLSEIKDSVVFIDLCDNLKIGKYENHALRHGMIRYKRYKMEGFDVEFKTINL